MSLAAWMGLGNPIIASPLAISGCIGWFDASDAATVTTSGGNVTQWNDKSTAVNNLVQSASGQRPSYQSAVQAGRNIIRFDGSNDVLGVTANAWLSGIAGWTMLTVSKPANLTADYYIVDIKNSISSSDQVYQVELVTSGFTEFGGRRLTSGGSQFQDDATARSTSVFQVVSAIASFGSTLTIYNGGVQTAQKATYLTAGVMGSDNFKVAIGAAADGSVTPALPFHGDFAEMVFYNSAISTTDHAKVVAYLKAKWGL